jgi:hypothetical protein
MGSKTGSHRQARRSKPAKCGKMRPFRPEVLQNATRSGMLVGPTLKTIPMAKLHATFSLTGPLAGLSLYRRKDLDGTFARTRTTISKERLRTDPAFTNTRRCATEGGGRSRGARWIRRVLQPLEAVRDHNWAGALTGALTPLQRLDTEGPYGQRSLLFSAHGPLLEGYPLSRRSPWESLVRTPLVCTVDKEAQSARVALPALLPGSTFFPHTVHPYFRFVASLGPVPDLHFTHGGYTPKDTPGSNLPAVAHTEWLGVKSAAPATALELQLPYTIEFPAYALVLTVGILFGHLDAKGNITAVRYSGSGRIVRVV